MRLSPGKFNTHLAKLGQNFSWRRAYACPCISPHSNAAKATCPLCKGKGRMWSTAVSGVAGIAGQAIQTAWAQFGTAESGDVVLTIPSDSPLYPMGQFDRVVMSDSSQPFSIVLTRGMNDVMRYPVVNIDRVYWLNPAGTAVVEGGIPTASSAGVLTWVSGEPPVGTQYNITGRQRPEFFAYQDFPRDRAHHSGAPLPRRVVIRRYDLYGR